MAKSNELIDAALKLAERLHHGQRDKLGIPYINHVKYVADRVSHLGESHAIVGLLHDSVEDTEITLEEIEERFGKQVRDGVDGMTKRPREDYFGDYLPRVAATEIAKDVKIADATHNLSRVSLIQDIDERERLEKKYSSVLRFLDKNP